MNAEPIVNKIKDDARVQAKAILNDAHQKAQEIANAAAKKAEQTRTAALKKTDADVAEMRSRMARMAELEDRKALLSAKREVMDKAFALALENMKKMPAKQAREYLMKQLLANAVGDEIMEVGQEANQWFDDSFITEANASLAKQGKKSALKKGGVCRGAGFTLLREGMEINCTYEATLASERLNLEAEVAALLYA